MLTKLLVGVILFIFTFCGVALWAACEMSGRGNDSDDA